MPDFIAGGLGWLNGRLKAGVSQTVTYSRGPDSVTLAATFGSSLLELDDGRGGVRMVRTDADFTFSAADLVIAGETVTPKRDDQIAIAGAGATRYYAVLPYAAGEPQWRYCDPYGLRIRVHTKIVEREPDC